MNIKSLFKNKNIKSKRMVFDDNDINRVEISFNAGIELGKENPTNTDVTITGYENKNRKKRMWEISIGDVKMPTGAWNGLSLIEFFDEKVVIGCSDTVYCLDVCSGEQIWSKKFEGDIVEELCKSKNSQFIYIFFSQFSFKSTNEYGNISKLDLKGNLLWNIEKPDTDKLFSNQVRFIDGSVTAIASGSKLCYINDVTGKIEKSVFCKY